MLESTESHVISTDVLYASKQPTVIADICRKSNLEKKFFEKKQLYILAKEMPEVG